MTGTEERTRPVSHESEAQEAGRAGTTAPTGPSGTAPADRPEPRGRTGQGRRSRTWLAVCAVALAVPVTVWLLPEPDGRKTDAAPTTEVTTSGQPAPSRPATENRTVGHRTTS